MNAPIPTLVLAEAPLRAIAASMLAALRECIGTRCSTVAAVREQHGRDESPCPTTPPEVAVFCPSTDEVAAVVRLAHEHAVPVIAYRTGSSLEGHLLAVQGGVSVDVSGMTGIVRLNPE
jgi:D-lactate dehydrogenase (cytochrome)